MRYQTLMLMICALAAGTALADNDPFIGTWTLRPHASAYQSGGIPSSMVIVMQATPQGIQYRSRAMQSGNRIVTAQYTAEYGGSQALVLGDSGLMTPVKLRRIDSRHVEASYVRGFQVIATSRRVVSPDGATMTITTSFKDKNGKSVTNVGLYARTGAA